MPKADPSQDAADRALAVEVAWMVAALEMARSHESRVLALIGLIRDHWSDAQIIALAKSLYPGQCYSTRDTAVTALDAFRRQHSRLLVELLLGEPSRDPASELAAQPFRAS